MGQWMVCRLSCMCGASAMPHVYAVRAGNTGKRKREVNGAEEPNAKKRKM